jgi:hypothetical protein
MNPITCLRLLAASSLCSVGTGLVHAQESKTDSGLALKLTPSYYSTSDGTHAVDINLRGVTGPHTAWVGLYRDSLSFQQVRAGYEYRSDFDWLRTVLSLQVAQGGFVGGSVTAEIGRENFAIVGWGRTNLRNYYNLNFDPNDAITLGFGSRALPKTEWSVFHLWDDRLGTHQHVTHAVVRYKPGDAERWTVDLSGKHGTSSSGAYVSGHALSLTYDYGAYFGRVARDQYVNFSDETQSRVSLGMRF